MVIRIGAGEVGSSISQLTRDVRRVMEPGTASRLKERRGNKLKDYVVMCGPLGVTHLLLFSRDVQRVQKHALGGGSEFLTPPLLVMDSLTRPNSDSKSAVPKHLETLAATVFRSLFPPINPTNTPLKTVRRVVLVKREAADDGTFIVNFRHYAITTRAAGLSRPLRRIKAAEKLMATKSSRHSKVPNLGKLEDIADYMMAEGYATDATSGSEMESDAEVEILEATSKKVVTASKAAQAAGTAPEDEDDGVERVGVKLVELGPRMRLRLTKVEEGLCAGKILWHEYVRKSGAELRDLDRRWERRRVEKEARRREQRENLERKRGKGEGDDVDMDDDDDDDEEEEEHVDE
ncbi:Brix domain protein [Ophiocordyceps camponoti-floridani]|uniref:Brix domain protein n=1 Tax=Ophiocordyceps camponoti-floridani TaxID=2030778 RepID=A0A8H4Q732_9HYPO|nr:Brix domain protein [Ophiocordyceps camponoti-floridani]